MTFPPRIGTAFLFCGLWLAGTCAADTAFLRDFNLDSLALRLATQGRIPVESVLSEPRTFNEASAILRADPDGLAATERLQLTAFADHLHMPERHSTLGFRDEDSAVNLDLSLGSQFQNGGPAGKSEFGMSLFGGNSSFRFATEIEWGLLFNQDEYDRAPDEYPYGAASFTGDLEQVSAVKGHVTVRSKYALAQVGKLDLRWGVSDLGNLLLSRNVDALDGVRAVFRAGSFRLEGVTARAPYPGRSRYLSAHRLSFAPSDRLVVSAYEAVVYVDRFELAYFNPFSLYFISVPIVEVSRSDTGSRKAVLSDNVFIGGDIAYRVGGRTLLYADLLIDDFQPQLGFDSLRNWDTKFAAQVGVAASDPFGWRGSFARAEYTFVNEYTYTHEQPGREYAIDGESIGYFTGPDADDLWAQLNKYVTDRIEVGVRLRQTRKGERGIDAPRTHDDPQDWRFLSGTKEIRRSVVAELIWSDHTVWRVASVVEFGRTANEGHAVSVNESFSSTRVLGRFRL